MASRSARVAVVAGLAGLTAGVAATLIVQGPESVAAQAPVRRVIRPERAPNTGLPFSPGILVGNTLYVAGHLGRDPVTSQLARGGIEAETRQALANIGEVLKAAGMSFRDVTTVTAYIADFKEFDRFNAVYREFFPKDPPARATVQVAALNAGARVELQMIAVRP
ncbi:MAG: RidA family protein [Acidobacteria bacterium]|nr:RidA family protein [Acidobacteriota bacterium]